MKAAANTMQSRRYFRAAGLPAAMMMLAALAACQTTGPATPLPGANPAVGSDANLQSLSDVVGRNPLDPNAYNVRGIAYAEAGRSQEALADFGRAIELNPFFFQVYANRALVLMNLGRLDEALADFNRALQVNPGYASAYAGRGSVLQDMGRPDLALVDYNQALGLDPADALTYYNRGLIYQSQGQEELAISDFTSAISFEPRVSEPHAARGISYLVRRNYDAAFEDFFQAIQLGGGTAQSWTNLGLALEGQGDFVSAHTAFTNATRFDPNYQPARDGIARNAAYATQAAAAQVN